jgi:ketosteroid isomerase-like protein
MTALDLAEIQNLLNQYCHAVDRGSIDDIAAVFHRDAVLRPRYLGDEAHEGIDAIRAWSPDYDRKVRSTVHPMRHKITAPYIEVDGERATAVCYLDADFVSNANGQMGVATGRYEDRLVKDAGRWWIRERVIIVDHSISLGTPGAFP